MMNYLVNTLILQSVMKVKKAIFQIIKILVIVISITYIGFKLYSAKDNGVFFTEFSNLNYSNTILLCGMLLLVYVNWFLESIKFKALVKPLQNISVHRSFSAVLAGITVSIFTPKRIGDFGGRIFVLESKNRISGIFATLLGSMSQTMITLGAGILFIPFYLSRNVTVKEFVPNLSLFISISIVVILALFYVYLNISKVGHILSGFKFFKKHSDFIYFLQNYKKADLLSFLLLSFLRYLVFTFQFFILLKLFGVHLSYFNAIIGISQVYLCMSIIPTFALTEIGVRGSVAVWVLGIFSSSISGIVAASLTLWIINLAIPALIGTYFLAKLKY